MTLATPGPHADASAGTSRWVALLLAVAIAAVYHDGLRMGFHLDDGHVIEQNGHIRSLASIPRFFTDPAASSASQQNRVIRPLLMATFALNHAISGGDAWSYHLVNILLHWLTTLLVFRIVRDHFWLGEAATTVATAAALVVAVHPLNTSAVNYVSARSALLNAVFYLVAFDAALRERYVRSLAAFALALLTKEIGITFPLAVLSYWLVARARLSPAPPLRPHWGFLTALTALSLASLAYRALLMPPSLIAATHSPDVTPRIYLMTEWSAYLYYLRLFLWPDALVIDRVDYPLARSITEPRAWGSLVALLLVSVLAWRVRRRVPALTFAVLWFFVALAAESTVFPLAEPVNEHRPYLAMLGLGGVAAMGLWQLAAAVARRTHASAAWSFAVLATLVTTGLAGAAVGRNQTWRDDYTLWRDATEKAPRNPRAWLNAGHAAMKLGRHEEARQLLLAAHRLSPCYAYVQINLSALAARTGTLLESLRWADEGVRCNSGLALTHFYRAAALERLGRVDEALASYGRATAIDPHHADGWRAQARLLERRDAWADAARAYDRVLAGDPQRVEAVMGAGVIHQYRLDDPAGALERYRTALRLVPTHYGAHYQTAVALLALGREREALAAWRTFVARAEAIGDRASLETAPAVLRAGAAP